MFKKISYILTKKQKLFLGFIVVLYVIGSLFELMGVALIMPFVSVVSDTSVLHNPTIYRTFYKTFKCKSDVDFILLFAAGLILIYIVKDTYIIISNAITTKFMTASQRNKFMDMLRYYMKQPYLFHTATNIATITRSVEVDVNMMYTTITALVQFMNETIISMLIFVYLLILDKSITIGVLVILGGFALVYTKVFKARMLRYGEEYHEFFTQKTKWLRQSFEGIKEIKIANSEQCYISEIEYRMDKLTSASIKNQIINYSSRPMFEMVCVTAMMLVVMIKIYRGVNLSYFMPVLSAFAIAAFRLLPSFSRLTTIFNTILYNKAGVDGVYADLKKMEQNDIYIAEDNDEIKGFETEVKINDLTFRYPEAPEDVFSGVDLTVNKNSSVAIIGQSGTGKTTLVDIILGLMNPQKGNITVDGIDVYKNLSSWHKLLGYIPQNIYLIDDTIKNNIVFGVPREEVDDERVWKAVKDAQLFNFINSLPDGIETVVGERGVRVSGGQVQRIGIARALYSNPEILVLDEATSALDTETETAVMEAIDGLKGSKTMIIIAHRLTTIRNCDYIYGIENKHLVLKDKDELF